MIAYRNEKRHEPKHTTSPKSTSIHLTNKCQERDVLNNKKDLIAKTPRRLDARQHNHTQQPKRSDPACLLLLPQDRQVIFQVVPDPQRAVDDGGEEHEPPGPAVHVVEPLVSVPRA